MNCNLHMANLSLWAKLRQLEHLDIDADAEDKGEQHHICWAAATYVLTDELFAQLKDFQGELDCSGDLLDSASQSFNLPKSNMLAIWKELFLQCQWWNLEKDYLDEKCSSLLVKEVGIFTNLSLTMLMITFQLSTQMGVECNNTTKRVKETGKWALDLLQDLLRSLKPLDNTNNLEYSCSASCKSKWKHADDCLPSEHFSNAEFLELITGLTSDSIKVTAPGDLMPCLFYGGPGGIYPFMNKAIPQASNCSK